MKFVNGELNLIDLSNNLDFKPTWFNSTRFSYTKPNGNHGFNKQRKFKMRILQA